MDVGHAGGTHSRTAALRPGAARQAAAPGSRRRRRPHVGLAGGRGARGGAWDLSEMNDQLTHYYLFDTAIGACGIAWSRQGVTRLQLPEADARATEGRLSGRATKASEAAPAPIDQVITDIQGYMTGRNVDFAAVAVDLTNVDPFQLKVYEA